MKQLFWVSLLCLFGMTTACAPSESETLNIFAAASLTDAFGEMALEFEEMHPNSMVTFNFAGSQVLRSQIEFGAQADVFASADYRNMNALVDAGMVKSTAVKPFLANQLVLITPLDNPQQINSLADLAADGVKIVLAAPDVPAGAYTLRALAELTDSAEMQQQILDNIVSEELNVRQVLAKIELGEADAGFVYVSDAVAVGEDAVNVVLLPVSAETRPIYPLAVLENASSAELAQEFVDFVLAPQGQAILGKWGFAPPTP
jgi:molybdate transport system substrate-binding protein